MERDAHLSPAVHAPISSSTIRSDYDIVSDAGYRTLHTTNPRARGVTVLEVNPLLAAAENDRVLFDPQAQYGGTSRHINSSSDVTQQSSRRWIPTPASRSGPREGRDDAAPLSEQELIITPIISASSQGGNESFHSRRSAALHTDLPSYAVITFDLKTRCPIGEEYVVVSRVKSSIRQVAPRCRIQAFKERVSYGDEALFDGVVQVVPMYSMLQVSLEHVVDHPTLQGIAASPRFWIIGVALNLMLFLLLLVQEQTPSQQQAFQPLTILVCTNAVLVLCVQVCYMLSCSRQLLVLVLRSYDWWMLQFWIIVTIVCNVKYTTLRYPDASRAMSLCEGLGLFLSLEACLVLDAFPPLPRMWKGVLYVLMALFNVYRYVHWFVSVRVDRATAAASIDFGSFELHLATAGQSAGAALVAYFARLGVRALWKKLDLQLVDFPVNMVPHLDDEAARKARLARWQRNNSATVSGAIGAGRTPPPINESSTSVPGAPYVVKESSMQWANGERAWLHVQGSLPCRHELITSTCRKLQETVVELGGKISFAVVDDGNHSFDCDRRTFEPHCFMLSFSPKPILPIPSVFRGLSTRNWVNMTMVCVMLGSAVMFLVNAFDRDNFLVMSAVQSYLFSIAVIELLCGVSTDMIKHALFTLDFWYVLVVFASQIFSGVVIYSSSYNIALAVLHTAMVVSTSLFISTMDCIVLTQFNGRVKGIIGTTLAVYCLVDAAWITPNAVRSKPDVYNKSLDLYFSDLSPGSIAILANVACFLVFCRVAGRTLLMGSRLVFMQFGAKEEFVQDADAALMASGACSTKPGVSASFGNHPSKSEFHSASNFAASRVAFFGGHLGDEKNENDQSSPAHWRHSLKSKNARFVKVGSRRGEDKRPCPRVSSNDLGAGTTLTPGDKRTSPRIDSADDFDDCSESDSSVVRFV